MEKNGGYRGTRVLSSSATLAVPLDRHLCSTPPLRHNVSNLSSTSSVGRDQSCAHSSALSSSSTFNCRLLNSDTDTDSMGYVMDNRKGSASSYNNGNNNGIRRSYGRGSRQSVTSASDGCVTTTGSDVGSGNGRPRRLLLRRKTQGDSMCNGG
jgi:hypothetical protein